MTALTPASGPIDVVVTYEDVTGEVFTLTKKAEVPVMEVQEPEVYPEEPMTPSEDGAGLPIFAVVIGVALLAMVGTAVAVIVTARRRKAAREDAESLAALSGQNLIDDDWA
ncbi:hypothetical protein G7085_17935 [Tessaracoccus sp. HDW20]|uniref:hypothetical protein n=1 Tax=Tessaracoccus coleopterorum TaxID=2714950 RepID=UPI0018D2E6FC|nr:hypothetical protein [Tessaracoccus coleopterorum]NHB85810.1 hypothetical protein [Tessaracoccus coleopterorum]